MKYRFAILLLSYWFMFHGLVFGITEEGNLDLPPIETMILEPMSLTHFNVWVPAQKAGPLINESCQLKSGCSFSFFLPARVNHTKGEACPSEIARLLAEYTADYYKPLLPLTIFNGWQWENTYGVSQYKSIDYSLSQGGGRWECAWEAVLCLGVGSSNFEWIKILPSAERIDIQKNRSEQSLIEIRAFSLVRVRDGYPKEKKS